MYILFRSLFARRVRPAKCTMACWQTLVWRRAAAAGKAERNKFSDWRARIKWKSHNTHTHTPASSSSSSTRKLVGRARPRGWKLRVARTRIRCTPGEGWGITSHGHQAEHSNHCVCLWLFARSAKQNWPLLPARAVPVPAFLWLCVRRPATIDLARFSAFSTRTPAPPPTSNAKTHTARARTQLLPPALVQLTFFRDGILSGNAAAEGDVCDVCATTNFIGDEAVRENLTLVALLFVYFASIFPPLSVKPRQIFRSHAI